MLSQSTRVQITKIWDKLFNPKTLEEAFIFTIILLRLAGLFPYVMTENGFQISRIAFAITLLHFCVYSYVNVNVIFNDLMMLSKPVIVESDLAIGSNLLIRLTGIVISMMVFMQIFTGVGYFTSVLNRYVVLMDLLAELGINTNHILRKMLYTSAMATAIVFLISLYLLVHSYVFYEKIANEKASIRYFYVVILANYYKNMCLFSMGNYLFATYLILSLLNGFLKELLSTQIKENEAWSRQFKK